MKNKLLLILAACGAAVLLFSCAPKTPVGEVPPPPPQKSIVQPEPVQPWPENFKPGSQRESREEIISRFKSAYLAAGSPELEVSVQAGPDIQIPEWGSAWDRGFELGFIGPFIQAGASVSEGAAGSGSGSKRITVTEEKIKTAEQPETDKKNELQTKSGEAGKSDRLIIEIIPVGSAEAAAGYDFWVKVRDGGSNRVIAQASSRNITASGAQTTYVPTGKGYQPAASGSQGAPSLENVSSALALETMKALSRTWSPETRNIEPGSAKQVEKK